ncbi:hypothetical protein SLE2022_015520 [Rubroshorea leprosula]
MESDDPAIPSSSSSLLKDISNFKTPKRRSQNPNFHSPSCSRFFTASKQTPRSSAFTRRPRPSLASASARSKTAARRLKAFELEQSKSSRKEQIKKEHSLRSLAKSLTVWLNFLFQNPRSCGCDVSIDGRDDNVIRVDVTWRNPKRMRELWWRGEEVESVAEDFSSSKYSSLRSSLENVCSFDDLMQRMQVYLSLRTCKEIFDIMTQVTRNIDEGRLKMKAHCPVVTDFGMKEKATRILMSYNPIWLRIGLYIIFGGDSLLCDVNVSSEEEMAFLKMVIEKQFFSHVGLAKAYAYNKMVEGLYRPGYYEELGNLILKRTLLLVLILDRAKSQSSLPLKYGIDGADGGSPLLFTVQSSIKSSCKMISDFLSSDVMHGEGNLLAHLVIIGYKVSYQQPPLVEFDFRVSDLFGDLQDGVRLCRAIQILQRDTSILMKMVVPSDTSKKNLANCNVALQYLRLAGVFLYDEDGTTIMGDDVANGDKELIISLLWNMFVHLQLPLLMNKTTVAEEIHKIRGLDMDHLNVISSPPLEMLLSWIQAICEKYDLKIDGFPSLINGKAIWCLLDYYFRRELSCSCSCKDSQETRGEESIVSATDYADAVHNFVLSQKLTTLLGDFPEVLQISDLLEHNGAVSERSVVVLLVFLSSQLIVKKNVDQLNFHKLLGCKCQSTERKHLYTQQRSASSEAVIHDDKIDGNIMESPFSVSSSPFGKLDAPKKFKAVQAWWRDMTKQNYKSVTKSTVSTLQSFAPRKQSIDMQRETSAIVIQSHFRRLIACCDFLKKRKAICLLQTVIRAWLKVKQNSVPIKFCTLEVREYTCETLKRHVELFVDRHNFVKLRSSVLLIQKATRIWIARRSDVSSSGLVNAAIVIQKYFRGWIARSMHNHRITQIKSHSLMCQEKGTSNVEIEAATNIQNALKNQTLSATKIQSRFRCWLTRRRFLHQKQAGQSQYSDQNHSLMCQEEGICNVENEAATNIQIAWKKFICRSLNKQPLAATKIQSHFRCWLTRRRFLFQKQGIKKIQSLARGWITRRRAWRYRHLILAIQRHYRCQLARKEFLRQREAAIKIQSATRCMTCRKAFQCQKHAAIEIQRFVRGQISRHRLLGASSFQAVSASTSTHCLNVSGGSFQSVELKIVLASVLKLQRWWRDIALLKLRANSAIIIQRHIRGWIARRKACRERHRVVVVQSFWKGYLARKESRQLQDLRLRVQKSAANVDDSKRIINRLLSALSELLSMRSVSGILHNCATLDMATVHSQKCCEELVAAGAIGILLKLIRSVSRSIPDQEILKHALSTLRNLARFPHLVEVLIDTRGSAETIFWELLRNKEEGYFIASEVLKKICSNHRGVEAVHRLPALLKRLHNLVEELTRKANTEKRNARAPAATRENTERRLKEAAELLKLVSNRS